MNKPKSITNEQAHAIMQQMHARERLITRIMIDTGLRITDTLSLFLDNVVKHNWAHERKTGKFRYNLFSPELQQITAKYAAENGIEWQLFPQRYRPWLPINRSSYYRALQRAARAANVPIVSPHSFRKLYAQNLYRKTRNITKVQLSLGHKYVETTATYLDIDLRAIILAAASIDATNGNDFVTDIIKSALNPT